MYLAVTQTIFLCRKFCDSSFPNHDSMAGQLKQLGDEAPVKPNGKAKSKARGKPENYKRGTKRGRPSQEDGDTQAALDWIEPPSWAPASSAPNTASTPIEPDDEAEAETLDLGPDVFDPRKTLRSQRHTFKNFFSLLDTEIQNEYERLTREPGRGKQAKLNALINQAVPRSNPVAPRVMFTNCYRASNRTDKQQEDAQSSGKTKTAWRKELGDDLFRDGVKDGDLYLDPADGLWHMRESKTSQSKETMQTRAAELTSEFSGAKNFISEALMIHAEADMSGMSLIDSRTPASRSTDVPGNVDDNMMRNLQDSFDATTRLLKWNKHILEKITLSQKQRSKT